MTTDLQTDKMEKKTRNKMEQVGTSGLKGESMSNKYLKLIAGIGTTRVYQPSQMVLCRWFICVLVFFGIICHAADQGALKIMGVAR